MPEGVGDLRRGAVGDDLARGEEHDPLAQPLHLGHVVAGDEQRGAVVGGDVEQPGAHPVGDVGIEAGGRLVEHEQPGPWRIAFTIPTSVRWPDDSSMHMRSARCEMPNRSRPAAAAASPACGPCRRTRRRSTRLLDPESVREGQVAGDEADLAHRRRPAPRELVADERDGPGVGGDGAEQHQQGRGLAGAVGPEQPDPLARARWRGRPRRRPATSSKAFLRPRASSTFPTGPGVWPPLGRAPVGFGRRGLALRVRPVPPGGEAWSRHRPVFRHRRPTAPPRRTPRPWRPCPGPHPSPPTPATPPNR